MSESTDSEPRKPRTGTLIVPPSKQNSASRQRRRRRRSEPPRPRLRAYFSLIFIVLLVYSPLLTSDVLWSDYDFVERSAYQSMENWQQAWTLESIRHNDPITITSFFLETAIPLPQAAVHRGINILLHILAAILLLKNLDTLRLPAAFSATLIFALHPATIQTLFWAGYRSEIIGLIFILAALYYGGRNQDTRDYILTIVLTTIACLIHPAALAIPIILALVILNRKRSIRVHSFNRVLPLLCLALFLGVWGNTGGIDVAEPLSSTERLNYAGQNMANFTRQALIPINSTLFHQFETGANYEVGANMNLLPFLIFVPFFILIAFNIDKSWSRGILLGLSAYLLLSLYGISQNGQFINGEIAHEDHLLYVALPMIVVMIITVFGRLIYKLGSAGKPLWIMGCTVFLLIEITLSSVFAYNIAKPTRMWSSMAQDWPNTWEPKAALVDSIEQSDPADDALYSQKEIIDMLSEILEEHPNLIEKRKQYARILASEGQRANGLREYRRILRETEPDNEFLEEAARFFENAGMNYDATKARERKTQ